MALQFNTHIYIYCMPLISIMSTLSHRLKERGHELCYIDRVANQTSLSSCYTWPTCYNSISPFFFLTRSVLDSKSVNEPFPLRDVILDKKSKKIVKAALSVPSRVFIVNQLVRYTHFIVHTQTMQAREGDSRLLFI